MKQKNYTSIRHGLCKPLSLGLLASFMTFGIPEAKAQLSSNPDKFLGNITTSYNVDYGSEKYYTLWNQITCENESKWASIEGTNNSFNWSGSDNAFNYAKSHNFPFKFHALIWGAQYPSWLESQTPEKRYQEIVQWMDQVKKHYPDLQLIDVVNEAITGHQAGTPYFIEALGGTGRSGYDWLIKAFELAHERWPNAILIYNDFNTFQWNTDQYIDLVKTLRNAGAPIDAYGCQSHDLTDLNLSNFKSVMTKIQNALKMPMYSTEYDIGTDDDNLQLQRYKEQIPYMWEQDYVAGVTLWGYIYGKTWTTDGNSGIIKNGKDRPAMTWLREYMKTDAAKNAKSPFPGYKKEASVYIKPACVRVEKGDDVPVEVRAALRTKTIERVELYVKNTLAATMTEAPYTYNVPCSATGTYDLKAIVYATDGSKYERYGAFTAYNPRKPYKTINLPGTMQAEDFDTGADGIAYHDSDNTNQGTSAYRTNGGGVDIVTGAASGTYSLGYTSSGEWTEYTVNVKEAGYYTFDAYTSANEAGASINLTLNTDGTNQALTDKISVPATGWNSYHNIHGRTKIALTEGQHILRLNILSGSCNIDRIHFEKVDIDESMKVSVKVAPAIATVGTPSTVTVTASSDSSTIAKVRVYADGELVKEVAEAPFEATYTPKVKGSVIISAYAIDAEGKISDVVTKTVKVQNQRSAYKTVELPGIVQAENFDKGGEGLSFHDSDTKDEGKASYRSDNEGVDIVKFANGYAIGYTAKGEWLEYTVNVKEAGTYIYEATVSAGGTGSSFAILSMVDGKSTTIGTCSVPQTASNDWTVYKTVKGRITKVLYEGEYRIRISITGANFNLDKINFILQTPLAIDDIESDATADDGAIYNLRGQKVDASYKGIILKNGKKILVR